MKILVIGGSGFVGAHISRHLLENGCDVCIFAKTISPTIAEYLSGAMLFTGDLYTDNLDEVLLPLMVGCDGVIFAAGVDDRSLPKKPALDFFMQGNVSLSQQVVALAQRLGVERFLFIGSYFRYFDAQWPSEHLAETHPYIQSRVAQRKQIMEMTEAAEFCGFLELPFVFGPVLEGNSLWSPLVSYLNSRWPIFAPPGGTATVSIQYVAETAAGLIQEGTGHQTRALCQENYSWEQLFRKLVRTPKLGKKIYHLPKQILHLSLSIVGLYHTLRGKESGLRMNRLSFLLTQDLFLKTNHNKSMDSTFIELLNQTKT